MISEKVTFKMNICMFCVNTFIMTIYIKQKENYRYNNSYQITLQASLIQQLKLVYQFVKTSSRDIKILHCREYINPRINFDQIFLTHTAGFDKMYPRQ